MWMLIGLAVVVLIKWWTRRSVKSWPVDDETEDAWDQANGP